ncbi:hypothetical protein Shyhy01_24690 [Streptomyces hygroscopicus subsp. hygroscopicus]|uniref:hypothetical protein n=1 Tax=Streptomyces sp. KHY 26 TaxID=3097359 RepID=UPI0024A50667|nr:hypothetical protein [Streptomyces hygroscopicus]GLX49519.1 hypothetical protein Shyhy01_24690 [Streptomyces hygroscopicus subsp. hygroscopicus]
MVDEEDGASGSIRRPWSLAKSIVLRQLVGLAFCALMALVAWPFGWLPDLSFVAAMTSMFAAEPAGELYRARPPGPPRRRAAAAGLLTLTAVALLVAATAERAFSVVADHSLGVPAGFLLGTPVGAAVFCWLVNRGERPPTRD